MQYLSKQPVSEHYSSITNCTYNSNVLQMKRDAAGLWSQLSGNKAQPMQSTQKCFSLKDTLTTQSYSVLGDNTLEQSKFEMFHRKGLKNLTYIEPLEVC